MTGGLLIPPYREEPYFPLVVAHNEFQNLQRFAKEDAIHDEDEIQAALDKGGEVCLSRGIHYLHKGLTISQDYTWFHGQGMGRTRLQFVDGLTAGTHMITVNAAVQYPKISEMQLDLNDSGVTNATGDGIRLLGGQERPTMERLIIANGDAMAINVVTRAGGTPGVTIRDVYTWNFPDNVIYLDFCHSQGLIDHCIAGNTVENGDAYGTAAAITILNSRNCDIRNTQGFCYSRGLLIDTSYQINVWRHRSDRCSDYGIRVNDTTDSTIMGCFIYGVGQNSGSGRGISVGGGTPLRNIIMGNQIKDSSGESSPFVDDVLVTGIELYGNTDSQVVTNNIITGATNGMTTVGTSNTIRHNQGYVTENKGSATVANGATSIAFNHGCSATPTRIYVTPKENPTNPVTFWWVDTVGATQATIHVNADPGASGLDFDWWAEV